MPKQQGRYSGKNSANKTNKPIGDRKNGLRFCFLMSSESAAVVLQLRGACRPRFICRLLFSSMTLDVGKSATASVQNRYKAENLPKDFPSGGFIADYAALRVTYFADFVCQIFSAYSFIALSAAKIPEQAVFISDIEFQRVLSAHSSSSLFCA